MFAWVNAWNQAVELSGRRLLLASCRWFELVVNVDDTWKSWILQQVRTYEIESPTRKLITYCASMYRLGKYWTWVPRRKSWCQNTLRKKGGLESRRWKSFLEERCWKCSKTLQTRVLNADECQGMPRLMMPKTHNWEQWISRNLPGFLSKHLLSSTIYLPLSPSAKFCMKSLHFKNLHILQGVYKKKA